MRNKNYLGKNEFYMHPVRSELVDDGTGNIIGDKALTAQTWRDFNGKLFSNGIISTTGEMNENDPDLKVLAGNGIQVLVNNGSATALGGQVMTQKTGHIIVDLEDSASTDRTDLIVLRTDYENERDAYIYAKSNYQGEALERTATIHELGIGSVLVRANSTAIVQEDITDLRSDADMCGWSYVTLNKPILDSHENRLDGHDSEISELNADIDNLGERLIISESAIAVHTSELANHETRIDSLETQVDSHATELVAHATQLTDHELRIDTVEPIVAGHTTELANHTTELSMHETRLDTAEASILTHTSQITDHETRIANNTTNIADHGVRLDSAEQELADHETRITATESENATQNANIDSLELEIDSLDTRVTTAETDIDVVEASLSTHTANIVNPHAVTKAQVGLGNADDTSDLAKPISTATQAALDTKAEIVHTHVTSDVTDLQPILDGKASTAPVTTTTNGLMISTDKSKLDGVATGANNYAHPSTHPPSIIVQDASNRFVTDAEKTTWNGKLDKTGGNMTGNINMQGNQITEAHMGLVQQRNNFISRSISVPEFTEGIANEKCRLYIPSVAMHCEMRIKALSQWGHVNSAGLLERTYTVSLDGEGIINSQFNSYTSTEMRTINIAFGDLVYDSIEDMYYVVLAKLDWADNLSGLTIKVEFEGVTLPGLEDVKRMYCSPVYSDDPTIYPAPVLQARTHKVWTAGNDGAGSGLDADKLQGQGLRAMTYTKTIFDPRGGILIDFGVHGTATNQHFYIELTGAMYNTTSPFNTLINFFTMSTLGNIEFPKQLNIGYELGQIKYMLIDGVSKIWIPLTGSFHTAQVSVFKSGQCITEDITLTSGSEPTTLPRKEVKKLGVEPQVVTNKVEFPVTNTLKVSPLLNDVMIGYDDTIHATTSLQDILKDLFDKSQALVGVNKPFDLTFLTAPEDSYNSVLSQKIYDFIVEKYGNPFGAPPWFKFRLEVSTARGSTAEGYTSSNKCTVWNKNFYFEWDFDYDDWANVVVRDAMGLTAPNDFLDKSSGGEITGHLTIPHATNIRGTGSGTENTCLIEFMEADNVTRRGYIGDYSGENDMFVITSEKGDLNLTATTGNEVLITGYTAYHAGNLVNATTTTAGLMSASDKAKLDGLSFNTVNDLDFLLREVAELKKQVVEMQDKITT